MDRSATYLLLQDRLGGTYDLAGTLRRWHQAGVSAEAMARLLYLDSGGVKVAGETIRRWLRRLDTAA